MVNSPTVDLEYLERQNNKLKADLEKLKKLLNEHTQGQAASVSNIAHPGNIPEVNSISEVAATADNRGEFLLVRAVPGSTANILYVCLGDNAATTGYSWIQVASG